MSSYDKQCPISASAPISTSNSAPPTSPENNKSSVASRNSDFMHVGAWATDPSEHDDQTTERAIDINLVGGSGITEKSQSNDYVQNDRSLANGKNPISDAMNQSLSESEQSCGGIENWLAEGARTGPWNGRRLASMIDSAADGKATEAIKHLADMLIE